MDERQSEYWDTIVRGIEATSDARDRIVVALSSSALGASIALTKLVFDAPVALGLMKMTWVMFGLSAVAALLSLEFAEHSHRRTLRRIPREPVDGLARQGPLSHVTWWLNRLAVWTFVGGVAFFLWFAILNLKGGG